MMFLSIFSGMMTSPWDVETILDFNFLCCPECEFRSKEQNAFQDHALGNHPEAKRLFCRDTNEHLFPPGLNVTVLKADTENEDTKELVCLKEENIDNEVIEDTPEDEKELEESKSSITWQCQQCSSSFESRTEFTQHLKTAHVAVSLKPDPQETSDQTIQCHHCFKDINERDLAKHIKLHHETKKKTKTSKIVHSTCELCGKNFTSKNAYIHHYRTVHDSLPPSLVNLAKQMSSTMKPTKPTQAQVSSEPDQDQTEWPCDECNKIFPNEKKLRAHQNNHKMVVCETCGKSYSIPSMKFHEKTCNVDKSIKKFHCDHCPYKTHARTQLLAHKRLNHLNFDFKPEGVTYDSDGLLICPSCPRKMERSRYVGHYKTTHGTFPPGYPTDKLVKCDKCGIDFPSNRNLGRHMRLCHPEAVGLKKEAVPKIPCSLCGREISKNGMAKHVETVHGDKSDKKYSCYKCDFKSHCIKYLRAHEYYGHRKKDGHY